MARNDSQGPVTLSVLDRLIDDDPRTRAEAPLTRTESVRRFKKFVCRDLEWLLNSRRTIEPVEGPETAKSVYHYGFIDIASKGALSTQDYNELVREMEATIAAFEPRLKRVRVRLEPGGERREKLHFSIEGVLCLEPSPEPVVFDSMLEVGKREYQVRGDDGAR